MCVALLFTLPPVPLVACLHESHPALVLRPPLPARQKRLPRRGCLGGPLRGFAPHLRRRSNAPNSGQRRRRRRRAPNVCPRPLMPAGQQVESACLPRASLPTFICAPTARVLWTSPPLPLRARWPPRPSRPCVLSLPAFARSGLLQHRLCVWLLPALPCRGLSKNPWTLATGWSWGGIQLSRGAPPTTPLGRGATLAAASPKP